MMMCPRSKIPWEKVYELVRLCGDIHEPKGFGIEIINQLPTLCPFDQARIYFVNGNSRICDQYLKNVDKKWATAYHEYYSTLADNRYALMLLPAMESKLYGDCEQSRTHVVDWRKEPPGEFITDYIQPMGLTYSLGFCLFDSSGALRMQFMIDRTRPENFTSVETTSLHYAVLLLNNLNKNFYCYKKETEKKALLTWDDLPLTDREVEIANLLCQGVSPANIGRKLNITTSTAYKHIAHIYQKMHVSSRQELLVRVLS